MIFTAIRVIRRHPMLFGAGLAALLALPLRAAGDAKILVNNVLISNPTGKPLIIQSNSAGDNVTLIDPATDKIIGEIYGIEVGHGVTGSPDGTRLYVTNEFLDTVDVVDMATLKIIKRIPLTGPPNNITIRGDGLRVYAAITGANGGVDIIDTTKLEKIKFIRVLGGVHNPIMTPDSKFVVAGSSGAANATVIDTQLERAVWTVFFGDGEGARVFCFDWNPDGSTKRMFMQLTNLHGFAIVDWATHKEVGRINAPEIPVAERNSEGIQGAPSHGILVSPDHKYLYTTSKINSHVYAYSMPDLKYLGGVPVGKVPDWITYSPDSKKLYVANAHDGTVTVVDVPGRKVITTLKVGQVPKRNTTMFVKAFPSTTN